MDPAQLQQQPTTAAETAAKPPAMFDGWRGPCWVIGGGVFTADFVFSVLSLTGADVSIPAGIHGLMLVAIILLIGLSAISWITDLAVLTGVRSTAQDNTRAEAAARALRKEFESLRKEMRASAEPSARMANGQNVVDTQEDNVVSFVSPETLGAARRLSRKVINQEEQRGL